MAETSRAYLFAHVSHADHGSPPTRAAPASRRAVPPSMVNQLGLPQDCHRWTAIAHGSQWSPAVPYGSVDGANRWETAHAEPAAGSAAAQQGFFVRASADMSLRSSIWWGARGFLRVLLGWRLIVQKPRPTAERHRCIDARRGDAPEPIRHLCDGCDGRQGCVFLAASR